MTLNPEIKQEATLPQEKVEEKKLVDQEIPQTNPEVKTDEPKEDPNWRAFREARKKDRAEREAAERRAAEKEAEVAALKAAMEAAFARNQPMPNQQQSYPLYEQDESEDVRIEKKVQAILAQKEAEYRRQREIEEKQTMPQRLQQHMPDFNNVVTTENLDYLEYHYPEIARPLNRLQDNYDKWADIYAAVKKLCPNVTNARRDAIKADQNQIKPKSMSMPGMTPTGNQMSNAQISEEKKKANWERMQRTLKGLS